MAASDYIKDEDSNESSKTYIELKSDEESQRAAYRLIARGGKFRQSVEDIDSFFGTMIPKLAKHLFEGDSTELMAWLELDEDDLEAYRDEYLEDDE